MGRKFIYSTNINIYHIECTYHQEGNFKQVSEEENQIAFMLDKIIPTCWNLVLHSLCPTYWYLTANHPPTAVSWEDSPAMRKKCLLSENVAFLMWCITQAVCWWKLTHMSAGVITDRDHEKDSSHELSLQKHEYPQPRHLLPTVIYCDRDLLRFGWFCTKYFR